MMNVQEYQCPDFSTGSMKSKEKVQTFAAPQFKAEIPVIGENLKGKDGAFRLDATVEGQLGLREKEKAEAEARIQAEMEKRWQKAAEQAEAAGYQKGLEEGKLEAYKAELPRIQEKVQKLDHLLHEMDSYRQKIFDANESFLMDLISQIAGMVALKEVNADPDYIRRLVTALLKQLGTKDDIKIYLSHADFQNANSLYQSLEKEFGKLSNTSIEEHPEIAPGGCKIETRFGVVDSSVSTQIENVMKSIQG